MKTTVEKAIEDARLEHELALERLAKLRLKFNTQLAALRKSRRVGTFKNADGTGTVEVYAEPGTGLLVALDGDS